AGRLEIAIGHHNLGAFANQAATGRLANTRRATSDNGHLACETFTVHTLSDCSRLLQRHRRTSPMTLGSDENHLSSSVFRPPNCAMLAPPSTSSAAPVI